VKRYAALTGFTPFAQPICVNLRSSAVGLASCSFAVVIRVHSRFLFVRFLPLLVFCPNLCVLASLADVAKGGDGAKSALRQISLFCSLCSFAAIESYSRRRSPGFRR
jgi:hypothetical protein